MQTEFVYYVGSYFCKTLLLLILPHYLSQISLFVYLF